MFCILKKRQQSSKLMPYTTLFRSDPQLGGRPQARRALLRGLRQQAPDGPQRHHHRRRRSEEHTSELQSPCKLVCRLVLEKKKDEEKETNIEKQEKAEHESH